MLYLLLAEDSTAKRSKIAEIKEQTLPTPDSRQLDFESLDGTKLDPADLKKSLIAMPAVAKTRMIVIDPCEKLSDRNKAVLLEFAESDHDHAVVLLNFQAASAKNSFLKKISEKAKVLKFGAKLAGSNVFDMTRAMERRDESGALKMLNDLLENGDHPLQIMGGLVWFWGQCKSRLSAEEFKKGLLVLQEADLNIKRSRLKPEYAVELAVTKLSSLMLRLH